MAQIFVENVFSQHVDWKKLLQTDDNYKNILQVIIQKRFKTTPTYKEISEYDDELGYHMGVYICLGQESHDLSHSDSILWEEFKSFDSVEEYLNENGSVYVFLSESKHKIKKKAEQNACSIAIDKINK
jgi:dsRNA-specific ribonuclease